MEALRLVWLYFRIGAMNEMQYRVNFFIQLFQALLSLATGLIVLALVFSYTDTLVGWTPPELLAVMGVHILMGGVIRTTIQPNMIRLMTDVAEGTLDFALTKPVDSQLIVSVREVRIWQAGDILTGLVTLVAAVVWLGEAFGLRQGLYFVVALLLGAMII
jgi:ABC-2 type transport system permease protein